MRTVEFDGSSFAWSWWNGQKVAGTAEQPAALDLETELIGLIPGTEIIDPRSVPRPALGMVYDGRGLYLLHPTRFKDFLRQHRTTHFVSHNTQFDWHVLYRHGDAVTREYLWELGDRNCVHDTMVLDLLLQLASGRYRVTGGKGGDDQKLFATNLGVLAAEWGVGEIDKGDEYRLRFGELVGLTAAEIDAHPEADNFFAYALKDVIATHRVWVKQYAKGVEWMRKAGWSPNPGQKTYEIRPDALARFGVLSEALQTKASIVLAELSRTPIRIDQEKRAELERVTREKHAAALKTLTDREPELVQRSKAKYRTVVEGKGKNAVRRKELVRDAEVKFTTKTGVPRFNSKKLVAVLTAEAERIGFTVPVSSGKLARVSTATADWRPWAEQSDFIRAWITLEEEGKFLEFLTAIDASEVYSRYDLMKTTGRTSAGAYRRVGAGGVYLPSLNIQQVPRDDPEHPESSIRCLFLAPEGHVWCAADYAYIEFRAMAVISKALFGRSEMAKVTEDHTLRGGPDPHVVTAASICGVTLEEFLKFPKDVQKKQRQNAKPSNFGLMSGMGADTTVLYYKGYGLNITVKDAQHIKKKWRERYPEMDEYLKDSMNKALQWGCPEGKKAPTLPEHACFRFSEFLKSSGDSKKKKKRRKMTFSTAELERFWEVLETVAFLKGDEQTQEDVEARKVTGRVKKLTYYRACTLTGRVRNHCTYTAERNTRFQSLAADGAKLALWDLMRRGYKILNAVHDEIGVALPKASASVQAKQVEKIMERAMEQVFGGAVPVKVEASVSECWSKA